MATFIIKILTKYTIWLRVIVLLLCCFAGIICWNKKDVIWNSLKFTIVNYDFYGHYIVIISLVIGCLHGFRKLELQYSIKFYNPYLGPLPSSILTGLSYGLAIVGCLAISRVLYFSELSIVSGFIDLSATVVTLGYILITSVYSIIMMLWNFIKNKTKSSQAMAHTIENSE
jgi:hypothetical protein